MYVYIYAYIYMYIYICICIDTFICNIYEYIHTYILTFMYAISLCQTRHLFAFPRSMSAPCLLCMTSIDIYICNCIYK